MDCFCTRLLASLSYAIIYINMMRYVVGSITPAQNTFIGVVLCEWICSDRYQLYFSVLPPLENKHSVSGTMIGYLQWRGFSASSIAFLKGICTAAELVGTILMPIMTRYVGLVRTGAWSIWFEVATLTPVVLSIYSDRLPVQVFIFGKNASPKTWVFFF